MQLTRSPRRSFCAGARSTLMTRLVRWKGETSSRTTVPESLALAWFQALPVAVRRVRVAAPRFRQGQSADGRQPDLPWWSGPIRGGHTEAAEGQHRASENTVGSTPEFSLSAPVCRRGRGQSALPPALAACRAGFPRTLRCAFPRASFFRLIVPRQLGAPQRHFTSSTSASKR